MEVEKKVNVYAFHGDDETDAKPFSNRYFKMGVSWALAQIQRLFRYLNENQWIWDNCLYIKRPSYLWTMHPHDAIKSRLNILVTTAGASIKYPDIKGKTDDIWQIQ